MHVLPRPRYGMRTGGHTIAGWVAKRDIADMQNIQNLWMVMHDNQFRMCLKKSRACRGAICEDAVGSIRDYNYPELCAHLAAFPENYGMMKSILRAASGWCQPSQMKKTKNYDCIV